MFITILSTQIFSIVSTIFMIWMIVDCIRNQSISRKGLWIFFILFTQFVGAAVYFFTHGPWPKVRQYLSPQQPSFSSYQAPRTSQPAQETFSEYERGYQAQQPTQPPVFQAYTPLPEAAPLQPEYEQSLVDYPEMPPMEQQQR